MGFYLIPSCKTYFTTISLCLSFCICGLFSAGWRIIAPLSSGLCLPVSETAHRACRDFLGGGTGTFPLVGEVRSFPTCRQVVSKGAFIGSCEVSTALGTLSSVGWVWVPILLAVWPETSQLWLLGGARPWCQNGNLWESSCTSVFSGASATSVVVDFPTKRIQTKRLFKIFWSEINIPIWSAKFSKFTWRAVIKVNE